MIVFKNYLKITKSYFSIILIYTIIFIAIAMITSTSGASNTQTFQAEKAKIAFINNDSDSQFMNQFKQYIQSHAQYIELENNDNELRDALFFRKVDYIMIVPKGFTEDFLKNRDVKIQTMEVPDSYGAIYSKQLLNKYLNTIKLYLKTNISQQDITQLVQNDLSIHTNVTMQKEVVNNQISNVKNFYNFSNYTLLAIIIAVVSMVMISFKEEGIYHRNLISSLPYRQLNFQLLLGNVCVTIGVWLLYVIASFILYGQTMVSFQGILMIVNSFVFVMFILVLSFLIVTLVHNRELISGISTVIGLGTSFIAGAFVPQELLSSFVLNIAKLTPSYWFISNNNAIAKLTDFSMVNIKPLLQNMGIMILFSIGVYILIQVVTKIKMRKS